MKGYLVLEDGSIFEGDKIGYNKETICEIIFNTAMTGHSEIFMDPSYIGQGVVMTYPLIGNYGLTWEGQEPKETWIQAIFVHEIAEIASNFRSKMHMLEFMEKNKIPGLQGINTRKLTKILIQKGTMKGKITNDISNIDSILEEIKNYKISNLVEKVSSKEITTYGNGKTKIALLDFGAKQHIINSLLKRDCEITVFPQDTHYSKILSDKFEAIVLSNGPGNPEDCKIAIENISKLYESDKPILGIGLGHQLMGLATGAKTYKLRYGHRGPNHPVKDILTNKICITSQNHGYGIKEDSIDINIAEISHINMNDKTVEGLKYVGKNILTVQYHPEACPGPEDSLYIFDEFLSIVGGRKNAKK